MKEKGALIAFPLVGREKGKKSSVSRRVGLKIYFLTAYMRKSKNRRWEKISLLGRRGSLYAEISLPSHKRCTLREKRK